MYNIEWSPYENTSLPHRELNIKLDTDLPIIRQPGFIYTKTPKGQYLLIEIFIVKGEIKFIRYFDLSIKTEIKEFIGDIELKLNGFVKIHFTKFTGVISVETHGTDIFRIQLKPSSEFPLNGNFEEISKLLKRI